MKITIYTPKNTQPSFIKAGISEYSKRLSRYCKLKEIEYTSINQLQQKLSERSTIVTIASRFPTITSETLAQTIDQIGISGVSSISFCLLTEEGLTEWNASLYSKDSIDTHTIDAIKDSASYLTAFALSNMILSLDVSLLLLYEQIYRSYRILSGEPYHK